MEEPASSLGLSCFAALRSEPDSAPAAAYISEREFGWRRHRLARVNRASLGRVGGVNYGAG